MMDSFTVARVVQRLAMYYFHNEEKHAINITKIVNSDQIRVVEPRHRLGFCRKGLSECWIRAKFSR